MSKAPHKSFGNGGMGAWGKGGKTFFKKFFLPSPTDPLHLVCGATALFSLLALAGIVGFLFAEGLPVLNYTSLYNFLLGMDWRPVDTPPSFGIFPFIGASVAVTLLAALLAVPLGLMTALYMSDLAPARVRRALKPGVELLAAMPSVAIGFFGMAAVSPFMEEYFGAPVGLNLGNAALMLAFMSVPTICSVAEDALNAVPQDLREASLALGATRWETMRKVVLPAARSGIGAAIMLGMSRSMGETMVVLMVAGGAGILPESVFDPVRPMTSAIAAEMAESPVGGDHYHALFAIGLVLFMFTLGFNLLAQALTGGKEKKAKGANAGAAKIPGALRQTAQLPPLRLPRNIGARRALERGFFVLLRGAASVNILALCGMCGFLFWHGIPAISWDFLTDFPERMMTAGGIWPCIAGTVLLAAGAMLLAFPLGVLSAVYLREYAEGSALARFARMGVNNLAGVPSVVFGLFGFTFFVIFCGLGVSLAAGCLTLAILTLPVIIGTAEEALSQVPVSLREASLALGAGKAQTIFRVVLPSAMPGILTGAILGLARAAGETAAIMFTAAVFFTPHLPDSIFSPVMALPNHIYTLATSGTDIEMTRPLQYGTAVTLILLVLGMNALAIVLRDKMRRNLAG